MPETDLRIPTPEPVAVPHFPDRLHTFVWRNWQLVGVERMAEVVNAWPEDIALMGFRMGLTGSPSVTMDQMRRSYVSVIRRNWHLLPMEQLEALLGWSSERLGYILREDDFLFIKLGMLKPHCQPLVYAEPTEAVLRQEARIADWVRDAFPEGAVNSSEPLFHFVDELSRPIERVSHPQTEGLFSPRFCYSYFAPYGDPLLEPELDPYPDGLLDRLKACDVDGVWLQAILYKLAPSPWDPSVSANYEQRIENLRTLVSRLKAKGMGLYLYLNEPRAMPLAFFDQHPELKGAHDTRERTHASLCTSVAAVRDFMRDSIAHICREVPDLAGFFTITFSENWTHCWAHSHETHLPASGCPRCAARQPEDVIAEVNRTIKEGIDASGSRARLIVWDWVWPDEWIPGIIERLPDGVSVMSVSEWDKPITRGGVKALCGEYSVSEVGPAPRAQRTWALARKRGLHCIAKVQASNTWENSVVPYIPAVANVAAHAAALRSAGVKGLMMSWTLGGYPSPGLEVFNEVGRSDACSPEEAMRTVATRRFGPAASAVVEAWQAFSLAFSEFPFDRALLYSAPVQTGPSNLLWEVPTGYSTTMVGYPYDDLTAWCGVYPPEVFIEQFRKVGRGFDLAVKRLRSVTSDLDMGDVQKEALVGELNIAEACAIHCHTCANQAEFIMIRNRLPNLTTSDHKNAVRKLHGILDAEVSLCRRLHAIQGSDSRIGFEASHHYMYVPVDLVEKVINCRDLQARWLKTLSPASDST